MHPTDTHTSSTEALTTAGVSIWLDDINRENLHDGKLAEMIDRLNVRGVTTNPTIFATALARGGAYDAQLHELQERHVDVDTAVFEITTRDVRDAADLFADIYQRTDGFDGRVSIEVSPSAAYDTEATIAEAERLWASVGQSNLMVKIPATREGLPAITAAIAQGISVNVTLIFGLQRYREVIDAYLAGLEQALAKGIDISTIHSVASFFVSRVDTAVNARLLHDGRPDALKLQNRVAVANARLAYLAFIETFETQRVRHLLDRGANMQRPLWASTGVKSDDLPDTFYVTELVGQQTVNTMPEKTLRALADHGVILAGTATNVDDAHLVLNDLAALGIDLDEVTAELERDGVAKFAASWQELGRTVADKL